MLYQSAHYLYTCNTYCLDDSFDWMPFHEILFHVRHECLNSEHASTELENYVVIIGDKHERQRRKWFSRKYYASVMRLKEFYEENVGAKFCGIISSALSKDFRQNH